MIFLSFFIAALCSLYCCYPPGSSLADGPDTVLTAVRNNGASTLEDGRDPELTTVRNDGVHTVEDGANTNPTAGGTCD